MQFVCNELSFSPVAKDSYELEDRFSKLLETFKYAKEKYNFSHIRFPVNYTTQKVTITQTYYEWVTILTNRTLKTLLLDLCRPPYLDDLENSELDIFYQSSYKIIDEGVPIDEGPIGLPIAFIKSVPAISLHSHDFWLRRRINMRKANEDNSEEAFIFAYNVCIDTDITSPEFVEWADNYMSLEIDNKDMLIKYLAFNNYSIVISDEFMTQLMRWKEVDKDLYKYILLLMKDVDLNPFSGGMGQTENLKYRGKEASKRINIVDRLSYTLQNNLVSFISCLGHYQFHD